MSNFGVSKDITVTSLKSDSLNFRGVRISTPAGSQSASRIFNDTTYDNVTISSLMELCGANISAPASDVEYDAYRQQALRIENANTNRSLATNQWERNGDESVVPLYIANFSKGMRHDAKGRVPSSDYEALKNGIESRSISEISAVPMGGARKFVQPLGGLMLNEMGCPPSSMTLPAAPSISSAETAGELVECYCKSLCRDVPFYDYDTDPTVRECVVYMNALSDFRGNTAVTKFNIFRGIGSGDTVGPMLSQFFFIDETVWPNTVSAKTLFPTRTPANNRMKTTANYLAVQNGSVPESGPTLAGVATYPATARDLAHCVWKDDAGRWYERAANRALAAGASFSSPYGSAPLSANQDAFVSWSMIDLRACLFLTAQIALAGAWYGKWFVNRRLRPEAMASEMEQIRLGGSNVASIHSDALTSDVLSRVFTLNGGSHYLSQTFPEGSPTHPSYPAGHAVCSGAGATIVKAFLDNDWVFPSPVEPDSSGSTLRPVTKTLTLAGEVNKLASNVALGRDWAGVHYRSDGHEGILLGEKIALNVLQDWINKYPEEGVSFSLIGYLGNEITISPTTDFASRVQNL